MQALISEVFEPLASSRRRGIFGPVTTEQIIGLALALFVMAIGFLGSFVPVIPGAPLVLIAAIGHRIYFGQESAGTFVLILLAAITVISMVLDYVATYYGAKRLGATWRGGIGAAVGGIVGLFFGLPGIIIGPFLGAMLLELTAGYELKKAARAGAGAMLGLLAGAVGKAALCMMMIGLFTLNVIYRS